MESYQHITDNIRKIMKFFNLDIPKLSEKSGISEAGLRKMLNSSSFKVESLDKIAKSFGIPFHIFLSNDLFIQRESVKGEYVISISYDMGKFEKDIVDNSLAGKLTIQSTDSLFWKETAKEYEQKNYNLEDIIEKQNELIESLRNQIQDKNTILDFVKRENMFAFANVIRLIIENQKKGGSLSTEQLSDFTQNKIFDDSFLKTLLDNELISEADYMFFTQSKPAGKKKK